jgi:hypothetical protein
MAPNQLWQTDFYINPAAFCLNYSDDGQAQPQSTSLSKSHAHSKQWPGSRMVPSTPGKGTNSSVKSSSRAPIAESMKRSRQSPASSSARAFQRSHPLWA